MKAIDALPVTGTVVIGRSEEGHALGAGRHHGRWRLAAGACLRPGEGAGVVARGGVGALSILAACEPGGITRVPRMYMKKMAVGPVAKGHVDLRKSVPKTCARSPTRSAARWATSQLWCSIGPATRI